MNKRREKDLLSNIDLTGLKPTSWDFLTTGGGMTVPDQSQAPLKGILKKSQPSPDLASNEALNNCTDNNNLLCTCMYDHNTGVNLDNGHHNQKDLYLY